MYINLINNLGWIGCILSRDQSFDRNIKFLLVFMSIIWQIVYINFGKFYIEGCRWDPDCQLQFVLLMSSPAVEVCR